MAPNIEELDTAIINQKDRFDANRQYPLKDILGESPSIIAQILNSKPDIRRSALLSELVDKLLEDTSRASIMQFRYDVDPSADNMEKGVAGAALIGDMYIVSVHFLQNAVGGQFLRSNENDKLKSLLDKVKSAQAGTTTKDIKLLANVSGLVAPFVCKNAQSFQEGLESNDRFSIRNYDVDLSFFKDAPRVTNLTSLESSV